MCGIAVWFSERLCATNFSLSARLTAIARGSVLLEVRRLTLQTNAGLFDVAHETDRGEPAVEHVYAATDVDSCSAWEALAVETQWKAAFDDTVADLENNGYTPLSERFAPTGHKLI